MGFATGNRYRREPTIPLAGFIDILFLLLTFFMTASVFREKEREINVSLPRAREVEAGSERSQIVITVKADGSIYMAGAHYDVKALRGKLVELSRQFPNEAVIIRGDKDVAYGTIVQVLDHVKAANLKHTFLATTKAGSEL